MKVLMKTISIEDDQEYGMECTVDADEQGIK